MANTVYTRTYSAPSINKKEILRYAGVRGNAPELEELLRSCLEEIDGKLIYKACYCELDIAYLGEYLDLGFARTDSAGLKKNLLGCSHVVLFAATVGIEIDRLIARYASLSPTRSLLYQAIGAERIESLCNMFNREIAAQKAAKGLYTRPRFSPGYGDFPIELQKDIFAVLDCPKKIGLTLNESLLMSPSKSVTAIIGISDEKGQCGERAECEGCACQDCSYRSEK